VKLSHSSTTKKIGYLLHRRLFCPLMAALAYNTKLGIDKMDFK
jgi:hypothetical protein